MIKSYLQCTNTLFIFAVAVVLLIKQSKSTKYWDTFKGKNTRIQQGGKTMDGEQLHSCQDKTATARSMTSAIVYGGPYRQDSGVVRVACYFGNLPSNEGSSCHSGLPGPFRQTIGK